MIVQKRGKNGISQKLHKKNLGTFHHNLHKCSFKKTTLPLKTGF